MDIYTPAKRSSIMSKIRSTDTKAEVRLRKALFAFGYRYRKNVRRLPGAPDIVLPRFAYVIQVRGCFWHAHDCRRAHRPNSNADYWNPKLARNVERDVKADRALRAAGWRVRVVWECEIQSAAGLKDTVGLIVTDLPRSPMPAPQGLRHISNDRVRCLFGVRPSQDLAPPREPR